MELFSHGSRFLVDGAVVRREPDRLIPRTDKRHDFVTDFPRMLTPVNFGEFDLDVADSLRKADFKARYGTAASQYIDYFKVWDLPSDYIIPKFPY